MDAESKKVFVILFKQATEECFGHALRQPLTETESKLLYNQVFEKTGLIIGWKSLKNYSLFILDETGSKEENPSVATLDSLARYVLHAPYTTETERKTKESHFPYWFKFKEAHVSTTKKSVQPAKSKKKFSIAVIIFICLILLIGFFYFKPKSQNNFITYFHSLNDDSLKQDGWFLKDKDSIFWKKRTSFANELTLFTLTGDNWPDSIHQPGIKNLLLRKINADCFTTEVHIQKFFPQNEWQQAGILLMEDTNYNAKTMRLSIGYNDFFGGFARPKEIIIQAITSSDNGLSQPEEIVHLPVYTVDSTNENLVRNNLSYSGLRIEKSGRKFRLLYSCSPYKNFAFKDAAITEFDFKPKYIGLFALQGFVNSNNYLPVYFTSFALAAQKCTQ